MSNPMHIYPFSEVAKILPQSKKDIIEQKVRQQRGGDLGVEVEATPNYWPVAVAVGLFICAGGIFLTLAAYQVLPQGVNAISQLEVWGKVVGYGTVGLGIVTIAVGSVKWYLKKSLEDDLLETRYLAESSEMDSFFPARLKANELFVVDDPKSKALTIYYREKDDDYPNITMPTYRVVEYGILDSTNAFMNWAFKNPFLEGKVFITLDTLRERTEEFEQRKEQEAAAKKQAEDRENQLHKDEETKLNLQHSVPQPDTVSTSSTAQKKIDKNDKPIEKSKYEATANKSVEVIEQELKVKYGKMHSDAIAKYELARQKHDAVLANENLTGEEARVYLKSEGHNPNFTLAALISSAKEQAKIMKGQMETKINDANKRYKTICNSNYITGHANGLKSRCEIIVRLENDLARIKDYLAIDKPTRKQAIEYLGKVYENFTYETFTDVFQLVTQHILATKSNVEASLETEKNSLDQVIQTMGNTF